MDITTPRRVIVFEGEELADLNPTASIETVLQMHAAAKPELATAHVEGPKMEDAKAIYTVNTRLGTKG